jgi:hypothetical protein
VLLTAGAWVLQRLPGHVLSRAGLRVDPDTGFGAEPCDRGGGLARASGSGQGRAAAADRDPGERRSNGSKRNSSCSGLDPAI